MNMNSEDGDGDGDYEGEELAASGGRGNLRGFYSYKNTFNKDSVWLDIPKHGMLCPILGDQDHELFGLTDRF